MLGAKQKEVKKLTARPGVQKAKNKKSKKKVNTRSTSFIGRPDRSSKKLNTSVEGDGLNFKRTRCNTSMEVAKEEKKRPASSGRNYLKLASRSCNEEDFLKKFNQVEIFFENGVVGGKQGKREDKRLVQSVIEKKKERVRPPRPSKKKQVKRTEVANEKSNPFFATERRGKNAESAKLMNVRNCFFDQIPFKPGLKELIFQDSSHELPKSIIESKRSSYRQEQREKDRSGRTNPPAMIYRSEVSESRKRHLAAIKIQNFFKKIMTRKILQRNLLGVGEEACYDLLENDQAEDQSEGAETFRTDSERREYQANQLNSTPIQEVDFAGSLLDKQEEEVMDRQSKFRPSKEVILEQPEEEAESRKSSVPASLVDPSSLGSSLRADFNRRASDRQERGPEVYSEEEFKHLRDLSEVHMANIAPRNYRFIDHSSSQPSMEPSRQRSEQKLQVEDCERKLSTKSAQEENKIFSSMISLLESMRNRQNQHIVNSLLEKTQQMRLEKLGGKDRPAPARGKSSGSVEQGKNSSHAESEEEVPFYDIGSLLPKIKQEEGRHLTLQIPGSESTLFETITHKDPCVMSRQMKKESRRSRLQEQLEKRVHRQTEEEKTVLEIFKRNRQLIERLEHKEAYALERHFMDDTITKEEFREKTARVNERYKRRKQQLGRAMDSMSEGFRLLKEEEAAANRMALRLVGMGVSSESELKLCNSEGKLTLGSMRMVSPVLASPVSSPREDPFQDQILRKKGPRIGNNPVYEDFNRELRIIRQSILINSTDLIAQNLGGDRRKHGQERTAEYVIDRLLREVVLQIYHGPVFQLINRLDDLFMPVAMPTINVKQEHLLDYVHSLRVYYPPREVLLAKLNQSMTPTPEQTLRIMRTDNYDEAQFQLILDHEVFLQSCNLLRPIQLPSTPEYDWGLAQWSEEQRLFFESRESVIEELTAEAARHASDMQAIYYKSIFDAINEQIVQVKCKLGITKKLKTCSLMRLTFEDLNLPCGEAELKYVLQKSCDNVRKVVSNQLRAEEELSRSEEHSRKELAHLELELEYDNYKWVNLSDEMIYLFLELVMQVSGQLISELAVELSTLQLRHH